MDGSKVLSMTGLKDLDAAVPAAEEWLSDLMRRLGWQDRDRVYLALLAALHALRDCLPFEEAIYLGAYFPPLLRGLYYEGCHPKRRPVRSRKVFLERIHDGVHRDPAIDAEEVAHAVFALLAARLPPSELEEAKAVTPEGLRALWPS
jgi:uncharacterized protein (DUF2267 family)